MISKLIGYTGRRTSKTLDDAFNWFAFTLHIFRATLRRYQTGKALVRKFTLEQIYYTGCQALGVIIPVALIIGSANIIIFSEVSNQYDLGKTLVMLLVREIGPMVTALVVILRTATAVTIEIGYMKVLHEIDAIEMAGLDPIRVICIPRMIGITLAIGCLFIIFDLVAVFGGYAIVWTLTHIPVGSLLLQIGRAITFSDILVGLIKAVSFGMATTTICLYHGFETKRGITEIPVRTSKVAIECFFSCLVIDVAISALFYL